MTGTGTRAWTASTSALSTSPPVGPAEVAPTSTPAPASSTSLMKPSLPALWIQPRADLGIGYTLVRTLSPRSLAWASVSPTAPTSGSVNVTRGTAWYWAGNDGSPRMSATTIRAW